MNSIDAKLSIIEKCGYDLVAHFVLSESCWMEHYYSPILSRSNAFLEKYNYGEDVKEFINMGLDEIAMYEKYQQYYSYVFYLAKKEGGRLNAIKTEQLQLHA